MASGGGTAISKWETAVVSTVAGNGSEDGDSKDGIGTAVVLRDPAGLVESTDRKSLIFLEQITPNPSLFLRGWTRVNTMVDTASETAIQNPPNSNIR